MILLAANETFYNGMLRWDLGMGSPNKAATLLALLLLLLAYAILRTRRKWFAWSAALLSAPIAYAFVHTFSRGGFVALTAGGAVLLAAAKRTCTDGARRIPLLVLAAALAFSTVCTGFAGRLIHSDPAQDASAGNRLLIWKAVPGMMVDAPGGWGCGNAGAAFMGWYQPLSRHERYRSLVNSHFTWLVEFGWCGRWAYASGWIFLIWMGAVLMQKRSAPLPLALWTCLGASAFFSSVAEEWLVWLIPAVASWPMVKKDMRALWLPAVGGSAAVGAAFMALFAVVGLCRPTDGTSVRHSSDRQRTIVGNGEPSSWIVFDAKTIGGKTYGRALRAFLQKSGNKERCLGIAAQLNAVPEDAQHLVLCGASADGGTVALRKFTQLKYLHVLSPADPLAWLKPTEGKPPYIHVVCGELSPNCPMDDVPGLKTVPGAGAYLPAWPQLVFAEW